MKTIIFSLSIIILGIPWILAIFLEHIFKGIRNSIKSLWDWIEDPRPKLYPRGWRKKRREICQMK